MCLPTRSFDTSDIKIIRCPYCGYETRATSRWIRSRMMFQCAGCGDKFHLHDTTIRKAFEAVRRKLSEITGW
jgi:DNA-directed RNA polymerase subunit RPC12/RpoP